MNNLIKIFYLCVSIIFLFLQDALPCTSFCIQTDDEVIVGKNYDWEVEDCLINVNKRNVAKTALINEHPASWVSKYGSVTFNQYGREMPNGGINEAGLVIEVLWLNATEYPQADSRPALRGLQWIQYQLDNFGTVEEVIASDSIVRINSINATPLHFFVCDSAGNCAVIEFLKGKMIFHTGGTMPAKAISNNTYEESVDYLKRYKGYGGDLAIGKRDRSIDPYGREGSLQRFVHAANLVSKYDRQKDEPVIDYAFDVLKTVDSGKKTQWNIVYDIKNSRIYFRTISNQKIKHINIKSFDFNCGTPVQIIDIKTDMAGDVTNYFENYTQKGNYNLIKSVYKKTRFLTDVPDNVIYFISTYPDSVSCVR